MPPREASARRAEAVEACGDQRMEGGRKGDGIEVAAEPVPLRRRSDPPVRKQHADDLDGVERHALSPSHDPLGDLVGDARHEPVEQAAHDLARRAARGA